jgi:allantoinase
LTEPAYPRDLVGYGRRPPHADWPGGARIALQFVLNYEEGAESSVLHGDPASETFLSEIVGAMPYARARHMSMESLYEYGSRAGVWRILRLFRERRLPLTVFAVAMALERNREAAAAFVEDGHEIASHGWRWINYHGMPESEERDHIARAVETLRGLTGTRPLGWYTGRTSENTRRLVAEHGGFPTMPIPTPTTCPTGKRSRAAPSSSCPTRSTPTTCASRRRRASIPASSSSRT